jgi:hypothetical protein
MGRREVHQRDLPALLTELEDLGATDIKRSPARFDGVVVVRWKDAPLERELRKAELQGWKSAMVVSALIALLIVGIMVFLGL